MNTTDIYRAHVEAEAAYQADDLNLDLMHAANAAYRAYLAAVSQARAIWVALPEGDAKFSAETNAEDTEGCAEDELLWLEIAIRTFEMY